MPLLKRTYTSISSDDQHRKIWGMTRKTKYCCS